MSISRYEGFSMDMNMESKSRLSKILQSKNRLTRGNTLRAISSASFPCSRSKQVSTSPNHDFSEPRPSLCLRIQLMSALDNLGSKNYKEVLGVIPYISVEIWVIVTDR
ncbi:hypothetical protein N7509_002083 [Penicillium cosmopolitanum]|uniref:Uncharacterized protein n=1 Tax=Penicillium cosmopolitanum TaxID=1131564 RepID=A0A9W9W863_9EURO|nr:uncharacterized protein N7509_002083 [Penicillium cosmopolitanum]KAJ5408200.1 hypothetical protein N7509_002083 [Penicillium cosmopolitanum]